MDSDWIEGLRCSALVSGAENRISLESTSFSNSEIIIEGHMFRASFILKDLSIAEYFH